MQQKQIKETLFYRNKSFIILAILLVSLSILAGCNVNEAGSTQIEDTDEQISSEAPEATNQLSEHSAADKATETDSNINSNNEKEIFDGYNLIEVDGGNQSGHREPNVVVDVGYGDREYYAFTNEYGQLIKVVAEEIILQDDEIEPVLSTGRYYHDEAKVPGVESSTLDEGHVIADSLGGVSNAYNITPQESTLNRHGDQAYMEKVIRDAGGCTDFVAVITYPNNTTQIPSHYSYTYTLRGNVINDEFDNVNPDEVNDAMEKTPSEKSDHQVKIAELDKKAEYIILRNDEKKAVNLRGWTILSVRGEQSFVFPEFILEANNTVKVGDSERNPDVDFHWLDGNGTWNNSKSDPAELYDLVGKIVDEY